ncbi:Lrp/AsnC ligand binding domain-containing protein [Streptomyces pratens]|uniref:Lrp/AsnC ligand binding domain-containing protein n=1 Tax=Streptomyces pratens TaxID=887456 RepID=UPI00360B6226
MADGRPARPRRSGGGGGRPFAAAVTGRTNLVISALCRSTEELYTFLSEGIGALPGVHTAESVLTLRRVKTLTAEHR